MTTTAERPREALLLFSQQIELDVCAESLQGLTHARFRAERTGTTMREARDRTHHVLGGDHVPGAVVLLGSAAWLPEGRGFPQDPVWVRELRSENGPTLRPSLRISSAELGGMGFVQGRLVTTPRLVRDAERASELADLGLEMVDQLAYGVLDACVDREVECAIVLMVRGHARWGGIDQDRSTLETSMRRLAQGVAPLLLWLDRREARRLGGQQSG